MTVTEQAWVMRLMTVAICQTRLAQPQDGHEGLVKAPLLFRVHPAYQITEPPSVNGADLFDQDAGGLTMHLNLGTERCRSGAARGGRYQDHRARQELIGLNDDAVTAALLLVAGSPWQPEGVDVTPQHA